MKKWITDEKKRAVAEKKWLDTYKPRGRISGQFLTPIPEHVYAPAGGLDKLRNQLLEDE